MPFFYPSPLETLLAYLIAFLIGGLYALTMHWLLRPHRTPAST